MIPGWRTEFAVRERMANPRREAAPQRRIRSGRWHGQVGRIRAPRQQRPPWRARESLTQRGDRS